MRRLTLAWTLSALTLAPLAQAGKAHPSGYGHGLAERIPSLAPEVQAFLPEGRRIAAESIILDTHIDVPYRLERGWVDVSEATDGGTLITPGPWPAA